MDHKRSIKLQCPTCGGTDFENSESEDSTSIIECATCHRKTTRDELIEDNAEHIEVQKEEFAKEIVGDLKKDFEKKLRDIFSGNKYIKIE